MIKIGFIGTGNMGGALAKAAGRSALDVKLMLNNRTAAKAEKLAETIGSRAVVSSKEEIEVEADFIFLGVKPQMMPELLESMTTRLAGRRDKVVLITMAAGLTMHSICEGLGANYPVIRIMPNTPSGVGEGMTLYTYNDKVSKADVETFCEFMKESGRLCELSEKLIDAGSAVSGCGPAFAYMFAQALADGGVACGLPRKDAVQMAAQMMLGSAKMILETGENPEKLKDDVCSPGGTTIQGVRTLEENAFRGAVMDAVIAAYEKTLALKK